MPGNPEQLERLLADALRVRLDFALGDLDDLLGYEVGEQVIARSGKLQFAARAFVSLDHHADFGRIERRILKQPVDRHDTPPPRVHHTTYDCATLGQSAKPSVRTRT